MYGPVGEDVASLIARYGLHVHGGPVLLDTLLADLFIVMTAPLAAHGALGMALPPLNCLPLSPEAKGGIIVDEELTADQRRIVAAHEIGHVLCLHAGSLLARSTGPQGEDDHQEREAWQVAAALLVPVAELWRGDDPETIAARHGVPLELVTHHPWRPARWAVETAGAPGWWDRLRPLLPCLACGLIALLCAVQGFGVVDLV